MARMHVANLEAGALTRKTSRSQGAETPLVSQLRQSVGLVHELAKLIPTKEIPDCACKRLAVQKLRNAGLLDA